jgi:hypothetical protein
MLGRAAIGHVVRSLVHINGGGIEHCLRQGMDHLRHFLPRFKTIFKMWASQQQQQQDNTPAALAHVSTVIRRTGEIFWVGVMFLLSQVLIWGLHLVLRPAGLEFLSSILGMMLVFLAMEILNKLCNGTSRFYKDHVKPKVRPDFVIPFDVLLTSSGRLS